MANAGEDIEDLALCHGCITNPIGRQNGQMQLVGDADRCLIARFFATIEVALQLTDTQLEQFSARLGALDTKPLYTDDVLDTTTSDYVCVISNVKIVPVDEVFAK